MSIMTQVPPPPSVSWNQQLSQKIAAHNRAIMTYKFVIDSKGVIVHFPPAPADCGVLVPDNLGAPPSPLLLCKILKTNRQKIFLLAKYSIERSYRQNLPSKGLMQARSSVFASPGRRSPMANIIVPVRLLPTNHW